MVEDELLKVIIRFCSWPRSSPYQGCNKLGGIFLGSRTSLEFLQCKLNASKKSSWAVCHSSMITTDPILQRIEYFSFKMPIPIDGSHVPNALMKLEMREALMTYPTIIEIISVPTSYWFWNNPNFQWEILIFFVSYIV